MELKLVKVPFEVELARKITNGECEGRIVTRGGNNARILCFDRKGTQFPIVVLIEIKCGEEDYFSFCINGKYDINDNNSKDLFIEIPEYMTFKDGDVIAYDSVKDVFFIIGSKCSMTDENPHYHVKYEKGYIAFGTENSFCRLKGSRLATEEERQKIFESLNFSSDFRAKKYLERFFPNHSNSSNIGKDCEFKPFDRVLVRESKDFPWRIDLFSHIQDGAKPYVCLYHYWKYCVPYEGNEHLLGTTDKMEEK